MNTITCLTQPILILLKSRLASQLDIFRYYDRFLSMDQPELEENYGDLCDLVRAIENCDVEMACKLAQQHVKRFNQYMKKREDASASG
jgi:DNA-binding GntR family transcriptional regulator